MGALGFHNGLLRSKFSGLLVMSGLFFLILIMSGLCFQLMKTIL